MRAHRRLIPFVFSPQREQRRPGPANPAYASPREQWPDVLRRVERGESYRQIAQDYQTSYLHTQYHRLTHRRDKPMAVELAMRIKPTFEFLFWRSLRNAPPLRTVLAECVDFLSRCQPTLPGASSTMTEEELLNLLLVQQFERLSVLEQELLVSCGQDRTVRLWDRETGLSSMVFFCQSEISLVAFSRDQEIVAGSDNGGSIYLWSVRTGEQFVTLRSERLYEGMNISEARGLSETQREAILALGAIERHQLSQVFHDVQI